MSTNGEISTGLYSILRNPAVYLFFEKMMGSESKYRMYVDAFLLPLRNGARVLDIGCGVGHILDFLPAGVHYVGYDLSESYIQFARKKYGDRAEFHNMRVREMDLSENELFDVVLADGLLHHLNDEEARHLFRISHSALAPHGFMFTIDPTFTHKQHFISRLIASTDRGRHVRYPEGYKELADVCFPNVEVHVLHNKGKWLQSGTVLKCYKR